MQLLKGEVDWFRWLTVFVRDGFSTYRKRGYECRCCEVIVGRICSSSHNFYVFNVYRNLDISDNFFFTLLTAIAEVQFVDRKASFLFVGDVNAHNEE